MKHIKRVLCFALALCMLASVASFAAPKASIVSPVENSVLADDSLLVSVKVLDKKKVSVTVFEEKEYAGIDKDNKLILNPVETKEFTSDILKAFATNLNKTYKVVESPEFKTGNVVANFSIGSEENLQNFKEVVIAEPTAYTATGEVGCFTKKIEKLNPGVYKIQVEVLDKDDNVEESYSSFVALQEKPVEKEEDAKTVPVEAVKTSLVQSLINFIKSLVK